MGETQRLDRGDRTIRESPPELRVAPKDLDDPLFHLGSFLQGGTNSSDSAGGNKATPTIALVWQCGGLVATINDHSAERFCTVALSSLRDALKELDEALSGSVRLPWQRSRWKKR